MTESRRPTRSRFARPAHENLSPLARAAEARGVEAPAGPAVVLHSWSLSDAAPPAAWAALLVDMRAILAAATQRGITLAGPTGTGAPVLDTTRIALSVKVGAKAFSSPFVMTRVAGPGEARTTLGDSYDALVLTALARARRHLGALLAMTTQASPKAVAIAGRLEVLLYGADDRRIAGVAEVPPRAEVEAIVAAHLDSIDAVAGSDDRDVVDVLDALVAALRVDRDARVEAGA